MPWVGAGQFSATEWSLESLTDGIAWAHRDPESSRLANKAAISHAQDRLGAEPLARLFEQVAQSLAGPDTPGVGWPVGAWSRSTGLAWTCRTPLSTTRTPAVRGR